MRPHVEETLSVMSIEQDSYNKGGMIAFMFCMVFTLLFFVYITWLKAALTSKKFLLNNKVALIKRLLLSLR